MKTIYFAADDPDYDAAAVVAAARGAVAAEIYEDDAGGLSVVLIDAADTPCLAAVDVPDTYEEWSEFSAIWMTNGAQAAARAWAANRAGVIIAPSIDGYWGRCVATLRRTRATLYASRCGAAARRFFGMEGGR